jgi:predicted ATP-grasp superfamily ATP-dependent carboligase
MNDAIQLYESPTPENACMLVGWRQWADAGSISSGLPEYLIEHAQARKIGEIKADAFYLFQFPGTHHYLRPEIKLEDGYRAELHTKKNEIFYAGDDKTGFFIFLGDEPHLNVDSYATAFFDLIETLNIKRVAGVGGVYGAMPYDKDREVSCAYSLRKMKSELGKYAVRFSNYEGGATIGSYLLDQAERRAIEFFVLYAFVPAYDLSQLSNKLQGMRIENDYKAWYDLMNRFNHMFNLHVDLADLAEKSDDLAESMAAKIDEMAEKAPEVNVKEYIAALSERFTEHAFVPPLDDVWERELGDILDDLDE